MRTAFDLWSHPLAAPDEQFGLWAYLVLFVMVTLSSAGVPFIGTFAIGGGSVLASHDHLDLTAVLVVSVLGGEVGGILGYQIGIRWGRQILERPGRHLDRRRKLLAQGERLYATWGRVAVFFTTAMISGTAKMKFTQFVVWNLITTTAYVLTIGPASYGAGRIAKGDRDTHSISLLLFGLAVGTLLVYLATRHHHRRKTHQAPEPG